jgi:hypothetical protein
MTKSETLALAARYRQSYRSGARIKPSIIARLEAIPGWEWEPNSPRRSPEEWVPIAETMAEENGGLLQTVGWLQANQPGLDYAMRRRPELFAHIPQENPYAHHKSAEEWVIEAENLIRGTGGILPPSVWILRNYPGMGSAMRKRPELFSHIQQEKIGKSPEEWLPIVEKLCHENGGVLPPMDWLRKNGYSGVIYATRRCPDLYSHIKREKLLKSPDDWVPVVEKLAEEDGGALRPPSQLKKSGYPSLPFMMKKHPGKFAHIPQQVLNSCGDLLRIRNGTSVQRRALEIKYGLRQTARNVA